MKAQYPRKRRRKRKCKCCGQLYIPDVRHFRDQHYCSKPDCRWASKQGSQRRWYYSEKGAEYRDPRFNQQRVREWRAAHPDYARLTGGRPSRALQETRIPEDADSQQVAPSLAAMALQDLNFSQPALAVGLVAQLTGSALQETIAETTRRLVVLGQDILGSAPESNPKGVRQDENRKTNSLSRASTARSPRL